MRRKTKRGRGEITDHTLLQFLAEKPGLPLYQIADQLEWSVGRVQKSLERLSRNGLVHFERLVVAGRAMKLAIPNTLGNSVSTTPFVLASPDAFSIEVPLDMVGSSIWSGEANLYGLDRSTIGISTREVPEWKRSSLYSSSGKIERRGTNIRVQLPPEFWHFYLLQETPFVVSASPSGEEVLVTVVQPKGETNRARMGFGTQKWRGS